MEDAGIKLTGLSIRVVPYVEPVENVVECTVFITKIATGETRSRKDKWDLNNPHDDYLWSEGNFSCDCNRALLFAQAVGEDDPDIECGFDGYLVKIMGPSGEVLYEEEENTSIS